MDYKLKYLKYKKKYLDLVKLMKGSGNNLSQEEINKRQTEDLEIINKAAYDAIGNSIHAINMEQFLGEWIIPTGRTAEEFRTTLESYSDNKTRNEFILDLTRKHIYNKLFNNVGERASEIISRLRSSSNITGDNLQDYIIEHLPFLNPYIDELPVTLRVYSDNSDTEYNLPTLRQGATTGEDNLPTGW